MQQDERDLLEVLKFELKFLEDGGYGRSPRSPWRPQLIFEDSPTCMNFNSDEHGPCGECVLIHLVPPEFRSAQIPCRHIPLDACGETLDSLYRYNDQGELEEVVGNWLRNAIQHLEAERAAAQQIPSKPTATDGTLRGTPPYQKQHPKCANPICPAAFHWAAGGKFFRFRPNPVSDATTRPASDSPDPIHGVKHYWLCERCTHVFTLTDDKQGGVILKVLRNELPVTPAPKDLLPA